MPKTLNSQLVDEWIRVGDAESFHIAEALARREGMLVGGSSGTAVAAALRYARRLTSEHLVVVLCADTGRNYLSKFFDDDWLAANKLHDAHRRPAVDRRSAASSRGPRQLVTISPKTTLAEAISLMQATGISQLPVLDDGKSVGSIQEVTLARILHDHSDPDKVTVGDVMARPLPQLETTRAPRRSVSPAAGRQHRRAGDAGRRGRRHRHAHRFDAVLEPDAAEEGVAVYAYTAPLLAHVHESLISAMCQEETVCVLAFSRIDYDLGFQKVGTFGVPDGIGISIGKENLKRLKGSPMQQFVKVSCIGENHGKVTFGGDRV